MTRYYGWYSCRARGERRKREIEARPEVASEPRRCPSPTWSQCIKRVYEINPLECPKCNGTMRIVAFVQDTAEIKKIMHALGLPDYTATRLRLQYRALQTSKNTCSLTIFLTTISRSTAAFAALCSKIVKIVRQQLFTTRIINRDQKNHALSSNG